MPQNHKTPERPRLWLLLYLFDLIWRSRAVVVLRLLFRASGYAIERVLQKPVNIVLCGVLGVVAVFLVYVWTTNLRGFPTLAAWLPVDGKATFHFINALTLVGFVFGALGIIFAVIQLRLYAARIEDYPDFYRWARASFEEFETGLSRDLWFMGSTILPGNVAHGIKNPEDIDEFKRGLESAIASHSNQTQTSATRPIKLLVPHADGYKPTYGKFDRLRIIGVKDQADPKSWEGCVNSCRVVAEEFQDTLSSLAVDVRKIDHSAPQFQALTQAYLICTDRRATYATPVHYTAALSDQGERFVAPQLVGYTTTNGAIVRALRQLFEEVWQEAEPEGARADLKQFYARHLKDREIKGKWEDIQKRIAENTGIKSDDISAIVDELDTVDHDHFLGSSATERYVGYLSLQPSAQVLDLGGGFGGPARYLASRHKANVTVVDINSTRLKLGDEMFQGLRGAGHYFYPAWGNVSFVHADLDERDLANITEKREFDAVISFLAILHCVEKRRLLRKIPSVLKPNGKFVLTDYIAGPGFNRETAVILKEIGCPNLLTREEYLTCLTLGGGNVETFQKVTGQWKKEAGIRYKNICDETSKATLVGKYGEKAVVDATALYAAVNDLFAKEVIDGIEIYGSKRG